ncbi:hypothetical protein D3C75_691050 [compost metagenome]
MADFDAALGRDDGHQAENALDLAADAVDHAEEIRIAAGRVVVQPVVEDAALREGAVRQVVPQLRVSARALQGFEQVVAVARRVESFQADVTPFEQLSRGGRDAFPVGE